MDVTTWIISNMGVVTGIWVISGMGVVVRSCVWITCGMDVIRGICSARVMVH